MRSVRSHVCFDSLFHFLHEIPCVGFFEILNNFVFSECGIGNFKVILDRHGEEYGFLSNKSNFSSEIIDINMPDVVTIDSDAATGAIIISH